MKAFLIALGIGAATLAATAPADAQPRHDGPRYDHRYDRGRDYRHDNGRRFERHHRARYTYYRHGRRYYGWR